MGDSGGTLWSMRTKTRQPWWSYLPDKELLQMRLKDLHVSVEGTWVQTCMKELNGELKRRGLVQAHAWISDEWFNPDTTPGIAVPFYLAHPRLARLERKMFKEVEGGTKRQCMQILRHEAGHIIQHAYALHRRRKWQEMFGRSSSPYPDSYRPNPNSKDFVQHLPRWYAQSHPDEDFAETFAVWLTPRSAWRRHYAGWPALAKVEAVDELLAAAALSINPQPQLRGSSLKVIESLAAGRVCLTADGSGVYVAPFELNFGTGGQQAIVLRGATQNVTVGFNGDAVPSGGKLDFFVEFTEEDE